MEITLTDEEQRICKWLAKERYKAARKAGVIDARLDTSGEFLDLNGLGAELIFCKMFNLYPDLSVGARSGGYDALTKKGYKVDVKTTKYQHGHLLATQKKKNEKTDIYVLMIGDFPTYRFAGFIDKEELFDEKNLKNLGHGTGYAVSQNQLKQYEN